MKPDVSTIFGSLVLVGSLLTPLLAAATADGETAAGNGSGDPRVEIGKQMYMQGRLGSGELMSGTVVGDVKLSGEQVICVACHRRSGLGSTEGQEAVPAVTGDLLYQPLRLPTSKPPFAPTLRPAYDDAALKRAIRDGIRSDGKALGELMPRYDLTDDELDSLIAYLKHLESNPATGVTDREMHFATVIAGAVDPQTRKALLDVLETYFEQKNRETRHETDRSAHAPWHKAWAMQPYRKWVLHLWELEGPPESWSAQLEARYQEQPVFAVVSGLGSGRWEPIHRFCEVNRVPCLFPNTDLPVVDEAAFYSVYFNRGMALEADTIAQHLADSGFASGPLNQVFDPADPRADAAATQFRERMRRWGGQVDDSPLNVSGIPTDEAWQAFLHDAGGEPAVAWLGSDQLEGLWRVWASQIDQGPARVYLSTSLFGTSPDAIPPELRERVFLVHPTEIPSRVPRLLARSRGWLKAKQIESPGAEQIQANAFFSLKVAGEGAKRIRGFFNREYLLERIEHMAENATFTSVYPGVSLGPRQRFASRGAYIAQFASTGSDDLIPVGDWIVPGMD